MKKLTLILWAMVLAAAACSPALGTIVYSGSQDVTLALSPMSPVDSRIIHIGGMDADWDDFRVDLWLEMAGTGMDTMARMGMPSMATRLAIYAPGTMGGPMGMGMPMGIGGILGLQFFASNLAMGATIGPNSSFVDWGYLHGSGEFGESGGYIGLRTALGQYGYLHVSSQMGIGTNMHSVRFDGWAYEDQPGVPVVAGEGEACDWVTGRPHKMHWPQLPDLSFTGIDISLSRTVLADDFKCTATGPITDIHIWGSFRDDILPKEGPQSLKLQVSIYADVPARGDYWSRPGELLWTKTFEPGQYTARKVSDGPEDWYDLATGAYLPGNHRQAWQYNFCIGRDAFAQKEGTIYWLAVQDLSASANYAFGWKTTAPQFIWNDNMVFLADDSVGWTSLAYPKSHIYSMQPLGLAFVITGEDKPPEYDLGDAPDSTNSVTGAAMLAYPSGVVGHFPTVYQAGSPPYGPLHRHPRDLFFLGKSVTLETEADLGLDEDLVNNLDPLNNAANRDGADDGLALPVLMPSCQTTTVEYIVTVTNPLTKQAYVNIWCDWNRDGDWDDTMLCPDGSEAPEWAVQNHVPVLPGPGAYTITSPPFRCWHPEGHGLDPLWVRITIADQPHHPSIGGLGAAPGLEGTGPIEGYQYGETEDYYIRPTIEATRLKFDWGDAPEGVAAPGYPTLAASNGARHVPVGPWLGNDLDMPDSEPDGQPDAFATGDNLNGSDDENGASIPPLTPGGPASATVEVNGGGGVVQAWIDFNGDRVWQSSEEIYNGFLPDGIHLLPFTVPNAAAPGQTFARFRISTQGGLEPTGVARDGEVEDYAVSIETPPTEGKQWCQTPDLTPNGIDIRVDSSDGKLRALADDFECKSPGKLTHIRLWGSWSQDRKGEIKKIRLRIYGDDPIGPDGYDKRNKFSIPLPEVLWEKEFVAGQFTEVLYHVLPISGEWWWDPVFDKSTPGGDTQVWQIDVSVKPEEAFVQDGTPEKPRIYWLAVEADTADGEFGWKTRRWPDHFMDDAVWSVGSTAPRTWEELRYPPGHPYADKEQNSVDLAFCLLFTTDTGPQVTSQPVAITQCPPVATTCPALLTECPTMETKCPATETRCPVAATKCPPALTRCPPTATECQVVETQCPAVRTKCPPVETKCPISATKCPESLTKCPPTATQCQVVETQCPVVETKCPAVETKCPVSATKCPEYLTKCPPTATQCQVVETQCPAAETRCPQVLTKCPTSATKCPESLTKCPPTVTECQAVETQCPAVETKCPAAETRCPQVATKCPTSATKCPESLTQCPPTVTECQAVETQCPAVETQCPAAETRCPQVLTKCPTSATKCPESLTKCPPTVTECQAVETQCPPVETKCPAAETRCPQVATKCPTSATKCPESLTKCPPTVTECQAVETQCPPVETKCPAAETRCPPVPTQCPASLTKCPESFTKCPESLTKCPESQTKCPPTVTACPVVETQCPPAETRCPAAETRCPQVATKCPTSATKCPESLTKCPPTVTACQGVETQCPVTSTACTTICPAGTVSSDPGEDAVRAMRCPAVETTCLTIRDYLTIAQAVK